MRIFLWVAAILAADRLTKILALQFLHPSGIEVLPGFFHLTLVRNTGVAFGMLKNAGVLLVAVSLSSAAAIFVYLLKTKNAPLGWRRLAWAAIAAGALGNAYDRIRFGAVIDFLDFRVWPVFNVADTAIVSGAGILAIATFFKPTRP